MFHLLTNRCRAPVKSVEEQNTETITVATEASQSPKKTTETPEVSKSEDKTTPSKEADEKSSPKEVNDSITSPKEVEEKTDTEKPKVTPKEKTPRKPSKEKTPSKEGSIEKKAPGKKDPTPKKKEPTPTKKDKTPSKKVDDASTSSESKSSPDIKADSEDQKNLESIESGGASSGQDDSSEKKETDAVASEGEIKKKNRSNNNRRREGVSRGGFGRRGRGAKPRPPVDAEGLKSPPFKYNFSVKKAAEDGEDIPKKEGEEGNEVTTEGSGEVTKTSTDGDVKPIEDQKKGNRFRGPRKPRYNDRPGYFEPRVRRSPRKPKDRVDQQNADPDKPKAEAVDGTTDATASGGEGAPLSKDGEIKKKKRNRKPRKPRSSSKTNGVESGDTLAPNTLDSPHDALEESKKKTDNSNRNGNNNRRPKAGRFRRRGPPREPRDDNRPLRDVDGDRDADGRGSFASPSKGYFRNRNSQSDRYERNEGGRFRDNNNPSSGFGGERRTYGFRSYGRSYPAQNNDSYSGQSSRNFNGNSYSQHDDRDQQRDRPGFYRGHDNNTSSRDFDDKFSGGFGSRPQGEFGGGRGYRGSRAPRGTFPSGGQGGYSRGPRGGGFGSGFNRNERSSGREYSGFNDRPVPADSSVW